MYQLHYFKHHNSSVNKSAVKQNVLYVTQQILRSTFSSQELMQIRLGIYLISLLLPISHARLYKFLSYFLNFYY